jgi:ubiquinone/menaquinone biosynthesis C-methylase UbiE
MALAVCLVVSVTLSFDRNADRETWQPPKKIMDVAGVRVGMRIGEAGAGEGYLTFHLARRVGDRGVVYANEISESDLETINERAEREGVDNIVTVLGEVEDPLFPERNLDMVIMVYVLHHLDRPVEFLRSLAAYLRPGASVVIVEKNTETDRSYAPQFMSRGQIVDTIEEAGYELEKTETSLPRDTIYIYRVGR